MFSIHACTRTALTLIAACALHAPSSFAGDSGTYLFDLDAPAILGVMDHYHGRGRYDEREILEHMRSPLDCRRHAVLCGEIGPEYTEVVLQHAWAQAARGEKIEAIEANVMDLTNTLVDRWVELTYPNGIDRRSPYFGEENSVAPCTESVVYSDHLDYRLRQSAHVVDLGFADTRWARSAFSRRNNEGKYKGEKADLIQLEAQFFAMGDLGPHVYFDFKQKTREKAITLTAGGPMSLYTFHVEGCGLVDGPATLEACACSGPRPAIYATY